MRLSSFDVRTTKATALMTSIDGHRFGWRSDRSQQSARSKQILRVDPFSKSPSRDIRRNLSIILKLAQIARPQRRKTPQVAKFSCKFHTLGENQEGKTRRLNNLGLVARGGFEPHIPLDSTQLIDSAIGGIGLNGETGESVVHFFVHFVSTHDSRSSDCPFWPSFSPSKKPC